MLSTIGAERLKGYYVVFLKYCQEIAVSVLYYLETGTKKKKKLGSDESKETLTRETN